MREEGEARLGRREVRLVHLLLFFLSLACSMSVSALFSSKRFGWRPSFCSSGDLLGGVDVFFPWVIG
jgi:hypothetical protein